MKARLLDHLVCPIDGTPLELIAWETTYGLLHIVQASAFRPPFREGAFDFVYGQSDPSHRLQTALDIFVTPANRRAWPRRTFPGKLRFEVCHV